LTIPTVLVSADDVDKGKPDPEGYLRASRALGWPATSMVVVEDSPAGVTAGRTAGAFVVAVPSTHSRDQLTEANAVVPLTGVTIQHSRDALTLLIRDLC